MSDIDLDAIRRALADATPEPWRAETRSDPSIFSEDGSCIVYQTCSGAHDESDTGIENAALIVLLRNNAEALLAEIERLRQVEAAAREYREAEDARYEALVALEDRQAYEDIDHRPAEWPETQAYRESVRVQGVKRAALDAALGGGR